MSETARASASKDVILMWLDSPMADHGLSVQAKHQLSDVLLAEDAYKRFSDIILSPPPADREETRTMRSWRAMSLLRDDLVAGAGAILVNATRAGLLAKDIFAAMAGSEANVLHVKTLLEALLDAFPSSVVSAACAGGREGMEAHFRPLLAPEASPLTLSTVTRIVLYGCLGRQARASAEMTVMHHQQAMQQQHRKMISTGHRRKFVRTLSDWAFFSRLIACVQQEHQDPCIGEDVCETILTVVECLGYPEKIPPLLQQQLGMVAPPPAPLEPAGEDQLLAPLGEEKWWDPLVGMLDGESPDHVKVAATRIMMGVFTLATGRSNRIRRSNAPMTDPSENNLNGANNSHENEIDEEASKNLPHENKLQDWGLTSKIHQALLGHLPRLVHALLRNMEDNEKGATLYFDRGAQVNDFVGVPHPGRCRIVPFTSWRLHVVTLLAEILSYNGNEFEKEDGPEEDDEQEAEALRLSAMNAVMDLQLPAEYQAEGEAPPGPDAPLNPWPVLCDWLFEYPENSMYHFQFMRLFKSVCMEHHEPSLRLVLQKCKFVSRAVNVCKGPPAAPLRGSLLVCLNTLRLRSQSLPPSAFLRQFLGSHDGWKSFDEQLIKMTMDQERPSRPVPGKEAVFFKQIGIDLGSRFAAQLGFDGVDAHDDGGDDANADGNVMMMMKKKKKRRKKKAKKPEVPLARHVYAISAAAASSSSRTPVTHSFVDLDDGEEEFEA